MKPPEAYSSRCPKCGAAVVGAKHSAVNDGVTIAAVTFEHCNMEWDVPVRLAGQTGRG